MEEWQAELLAGSIGVATGGLGLIGWWFKDIVTRLKSVDGAVNNKHLHGEDRTLYKVALDMSRDLSDLKVELTEVKIEVQDIRENCLRQDESRNTPKRD